ncbi:MAG: hypothetical protein EZS28_054632, partial [Streblomastix strix]
RLADLVKEQFGPLLEVAMKSLLRTAQKSSGIRVFFSEQSLCDNLRVNSSGKLGDESIIFIDEKNKEVDIEGGKAENDRTNALKTISQIAVSLGKNLGQNYSQQVIDTCNLILQEHEGIFSPIRQATVTMVEVIDKVKKKYNQRFNKNTIHKQHSARSNSQLMSDFCCSSNAFNIQ